MNFIMTICILPNMSVEVTTKYDQLIFAIFWDKGDQIFENLSFIYSVSPLSIQLLRFVCQLAVDLLFTCFTSNILSIHFSVTSIPMPPRPKLFPTQYILYSLFFPVINLADASLHLTSCTHHTSTFLVNVSTTPVWLLMVPVFKLPKLNFCSVSMVPDCWMTIWRCSGLTPALPCASPSSMTPVPFTQLWFAHNKSIIEILEQVLRLYALSNKSITEKLEQVLRHYALGNSNQFRRLETQYFYRETISRRLPTKAKEQFTCPWKQDYPPPVLKLVFYV